MSSLISFIFLISILVFVHELGHYLAARSVGVRVEKFYIGFNWFGLGWKKKIGDTEYGIGFFPLGGYVKVAGIIDESMDTNSSSLPDEFRSKPAWAQVWIMSAGVIMNFLLAIVINCSLIFFQGVGQVQNDSKIGTIVPDYPAQNLGLKINDRVIAIDGTEVNSWDEMTSIVHNKPSKKILLEWDRNGLIFSDSIITKQEERFINGEKRIIGLIGVGPEVIMKEVTFFQSINLGIKRTWELSKLMIYGIIGLISGEVNLNEMAGPVMIAKIAGETAEVGFSALLGLMAFLSINLGLVNILPIPGLDGGHIIIALVEGILGRELSLKVKMGIQQSGVLLLVSLTIFIMYNDLTKLFNQ